MKKITFTLFIALVFVFSSVNSFAGEIPIMGRTCGIPNTPPCPLADEQPTEDTTYYKTVIDYLAQLFG